jgi:hypothetical protein
MLHKFQSVQSMDDATSHHAPPVTPPYSEWIDLEGAALRKIVAGVVPVTKWNLVMRTWPIATTSGSAPKTAW